MLLLAACRVDMRTTVNVAENGSGTIMVVVTADAEVVSNAPELTTSLNLDDLRTAGWTVDVQSPNADGGLSVTVQRGFANADEASLFLSQLSGDNGPLRNLSLTRAGSVNDARYALTGQAGLPQGVAGFADSEALAVLGSPPFAASLEAQGVVLSDVLTMDLTLTMPGKVVANNANTVLSTEDDLAATFRWTIPTDQSEIALDASTRDRDVSAMVASYIATALLVVLILMVAGGVLYVATVAYRRKGSTPAS